MNAEPERLVLYFTKGIADIALHELRARVGDQADIRALTDRFALVDTNSTTIHRIVRLRTIDDLRYLIAGPDVVETRTDFCRLIESAHSNLRKKLYILEGKVGLHLSLTISARNPVWRNNWDPGAVIKFVIPKVLVDSRQREAIDLRLQADGNQVHLSVSMMEWTHRDRPYTQARRSGALRPSVAAALVHSAEMLNGEILVNGIYDPCCGTGTILAEACLAGHVPWGSDSDTKAVDLTRALLSTTMCSEPSRTLIEEESLHCIFKHDIMMGFPKRVPCRAVVTNLPWGKQIAIQHRTAFRTSAVNVALTALERQGACIILTTEDREFVNLLTKEAKRRRQKFEVTTYRLGLLGQTPGLVRARAES